MQKGGCKSGEEDRRERKENKEHETIFDKGQRRNQEGRCEPCASHALVARKAPVASTADVEGAYKITRTLER